MILKAEKTEKVDFESLAEACEGYSGADISSVCQDAAMMPLRRVIDKINEEVRHGLRGCPRSPTRAQVDDPSERIRRMREENAKAETEGTPPITNQDLLHALRKVRPSVGAQDLDRFRTWERDFGST